MSTPKNKKAKSKNDKANTTPISGNSKNNNSSSSWQKPEQWMTGVKKNKNMHRHANAGEGRGGDTPQSAAASSDNSNLTSAIVTAGNASASSLFGEGNSEGGEQSEDVEKVFSLKKFLKIEILGIGEFGNAQAEAVEKIDNFFSVPWKFEMMILFGCCAALDSFIYMITYLPIRFVYSFLLLCLEIITRTFRLGGSWVLSFNDSNNDGLKSRNIFFHRAHAYDLIRGVLLFVSVCVVSLLDMSQVYHYIKMQTTVKLYVLTAMMEILDKLLFSFGQDAFDSLFWKVKNFTSNDTSTVAVSLIIVAVYVVVHSSLFFVNIVVAVKISDNSLFAVIILNNFAEIKQFVYRKFDAEGLFRLACVDITERFQTTLFFILVSVVGMCQESEELWVRVSFAYA